MKSGSKKKRRTNEASKVERSSSNVFADLDLPDSAERLARAELTQKICDIIAAQKLTQSQAAALLGIDQPKISALVRGKLDGFSTDRLIRFLNALGQDIEIVIRPKSRAVGQSRVRVFRAAKAS